MRGEGTLVEGVSLNLSLRHEVARVIVWHGVTRMKSKDGVRAASRQWISAQRSPHRTSSFHHIRRSNSGWFPYWIPFSHFSSCWFQEPTALPLGFVCPEFLDPFPLSSSFLEALDGRDSVGYYGSAAPT